MLITSAVTFQSKKYPEVKYRLRNMLHSRRVEFNMATNAIYQEIHDLRQQAMPIEDELEKAVKAAKIEPCTCTHDRSEEDTHDKDSGRCSYPRCECRKPKMDGSFGSEDKLFELRVGILEAAAYKLYPAYIRWGVIKVQGLNLMNEEDSEVPSTVENFLAYATEDLIAEVGREIERMSKLSSEEVLGFKQPTTSDGQVDGQIDGTIAPSANATDSISKDAAFATSQS